MPGMLGLYVYYKIDPQRVAVTRAAVDRVLAQIARETGVVGRLMARIDDASTWMEIYEPVTDLVAFEAALNRAVASAAVLPLLIGGKRVIERFETL